MPLDAKPRRPGVQPPDAKPGMPGYQPPLPGRRRPRDAKPGRPGYQPVLRGDPLGMLGDFSAPPRKPDAKPDRPGAQPPRPGGRSEAHDRLAKMPAAQAHKIIRDQQARADREFKAHRGAMEKAARAAKAGKVSPAVEKKLATRAAILHFRRVRYRIARHIMALAEKLERSNPKLAAQLRLAARGVLAAKVRIVNGRPEIVCPGPLRGADLGDGTPGAAYTGSEMVPQAPAVLVPESPEAVIRRALANAGAMAIPQAAGLPAAVGLVPPLRDVSLPGVAAAQPWGRLPGQQAPSPGMTMALPFTVPGTVADPARAFPVPAAAQHPSMSAPGVARPAPRLVVLGPDAIVAAPAAAPAPQAAQATAGIDGLDDYDVGGLDGDALASDVLGVAPMVRRARRAVMRRARRRGEAMEPAEAAGAVAESEAAGEEGEASEDADLGGVGEDLVAGVKRLGAGILKVAKGILLFPVAVFGHVVKLGVHLGGNLSMLGLGVVGGLAALGAAGPVLLAAIVADLVDDEVALAREVKRPPRAGAREARARRLLAMIKAGKSPC